MPCDGRSYLELYCLLYGISVDVKETAKPRYAYENDKPDRGHGQHTRSIVINSPWHAWSRVLTANTSVLHSQEAMHWSAAVLINTWTCVELFSIIPGITPTTSHRIAKSYLSSVYTHCSPWRTEPCLANLLIIPSKQIFIISSKLPKMLQFCPLLPIGKHNITLSHPKYNTKRKIVKSNIIKQPDVWANWKKVDRLEVDAP